MGNPVLIKSFTAAAAISDRRIVKFSATDQVTMAIAATDSMVGVCGEVAPAAGERCDVTLVGIALVEAGAVVAQGAFVTADASGRGVVAAPAVGVNNRVIGIALEAATAAGDEIRVLLQPGQVQG